MASPWNRLHLSLQQFVPEGFSFLFILAVFSVCCMCQFIICSVKCLHAGINVTMHDVSFWPFDDVLAGVTVGRQ